MVISSVYLQAAWPMGLVCAILSLLLSICLYIPTAFPNVDVNSIWNWIILFSAIYLGIMKNYVVAFIHFKIVTISRSSSHYNLFTFFESCYWKIFHCVSEKTIVALLLSKHVGHRLGWLPAPYVPHLGAGMGNHFGRTFHTVSWL